MSELKEAIERYTKHAEVILSMQHPKESPYTYIEVSTGAAGMVNEAWDKDAHLLARAYLATIPPDGEEPITAEWLREVWEAKIDFYEGTTYDVVEYHRIIFGDMDCGINVEFQDSTVLVYLYDAGAERISTELPHITTRAQLSALMTALGITPKAKEGR